MKKLLLSLILTALVMGPFSGVGVAQSLRASAFQAETKGTPGEYIDVHVDITNLTSDRLQVRIQRTKLAVPDGWSCSLCLKNCFAPTATDMTDWLEANETAFFKVTFETSTTPTEGLVEYTIAPADNPQEAIGLSFKVNTQGTTGVQSVHTPKSVALGQNFPNPFSLSHGQQTTVAYSLPRGGAVSMTIYDMLGNEVRTIVNAWLPAGNYSAAWDARDRNGVTVPPGIYVCKLATASESISRRILVTH